MGHICGDPNSPCDGDCMEKAAESHIYHQNQILRTALQELLTKVEDWCKAVDKDASWDGWDDHFKDLHYNGGLDKYRVILARAKLQDWKDQSAKSNTVIGRQPPPEL